MFEKLPSLRGFQPKFYSGGPVCFHLPLLYDLIAEAKPKRLVVVGFGGGDAFFTGCQAAAEMKIDCECLAVRRDRAGEPETDDGAWREGREYGEEFYGERARFVASVANGFAEIADGSVDVLVLDDSDSGNEIRADLAAWKAKLSPNAILLVHGLGLERDDSVGAAWRDWAAHHPNVVFPAGLGLGVLTFAAPTAFLSFLIENGNSLTQIYYCISERIDATARMLIAERKSAAFETRQVWLDSLLTDRRKVQEIMD